MLRGAAHSAPQPFYTIHVGNLSPAIHGDMLRSIFGHFGTIVDIRLIAQNGPASYGFVDYATEAAAQAALSMTGTEFDGRRLGSSSRPPGQRRRARRPPARARGRGGGSHEIFVGGLSLGMLSAEPLVAYFSRFGAVVDASVVRESGDGASKGFSVRALRRGARRRGGAGRRAPRRRRPHAQRRVQQPRADRGAAPPAPRRASAGAAKVKAEARDRRRRRRSASSSSSRSRSPARRRKRSRSRDGSRSESRRSRGGGKPAVGDGRGIAVDALFDAAPKLEEYARKRVWVEFDDAREAAAAAASLASRTYDGRTLAVEIVDARRARSAKPAGRPPPRRQRLAAGRAYHGAQHKLLQARVDELEAELEAARASAKKDRDFHSSRVAR
ncbi:RNA-binding protein [Aureococcus anophagefferens]|uniref:RNA-binding protein n=1 Tax=Aureococcus anophagefferens TaxID=44056 RepID=A0ABR1FZE8_AURAN